MLILSCIYIICMFLIESYKTVEELKEMVLVGDKELIALYDSGNNVEYNNKDVIFIHSTYKTQEFKEVDKIYIDTINNKELITIYIGPSIFIKNCKKEVYYSFVDNIKYDVILNKNNRRIK